MRNKTQNNKASNKTPPRREVNNKQKKIHEPRNKQIANKKNEKCTAMQAHIRQIRKKKLTRNTPQKEEPTMMDKINKKNIETKKSKETKDDTIHDTEKTTHTRKRKSNTKPSNGTTKKKKEDHG